jgi:thiol:disulfide interchange protein DsbC
MPRFLLAAFFAAVISFTAADSAPAFEAGGCVGEKGCMGDCTDCHKLTVEEADKLLKTERFQARVKEVRMSPVKGLWEVEIERGGKSFVVYVDFEKKHLVEGSFVPVEQIGKPPPLAKVDLKKIPLEDAVVMGDAKVEKKIIVFDDPDCPFCSKFHAVAKEVLEKRDDVVFYLKLYPLPIHPDAYDKSRAIICNDRSLKLLEDAFAGKELPEPDCEAKEVDATIALARELGIRGTPAIIFPDGRLLPGYVNLETFLDILDNPQ